MINNQAAIRDRVLKCQRDMMASVRLWVASYYPHETDVLRELETDKDQGFENLVKLADAFMVVLGGAPPKPVKPRFSKTRRAASKVAGRKQAKAKAELAALRQGETDGQA